MGYNAHQKLIDNITAVRIALEWKPGDKLTNAHAEALRKYAGFGGIKAMLYPNSTKENWIKQKATENDLKLFDDVMQLHDLLQQHLDTNDYKQVISSLKNSMLTAFYTPRIVPQTLYGVLKDKGLHPESIYEPSAGSGVFVTEAANAFRHLSNVTAIEKDILSGRVLTALGSSIPVPVSVQTKPFEETGNDKNNQFDLIVSNIPFGNFRVYDKAFDDDVITGKIHNYFFAKGLHKIKDGGILAYVTTDAFLNTASNKKAREYLFHNADFVSLTVMPDNLMKDTGNTEASSHLLVVQKNTAKDSLSEDEELLLNTVGKQNQYGAYHINQYIHQHPEIIAGDEIKPGKDQYGKAHETVWQHGDINLIARKIEENLFDGFTKRFNRQAYVLFAKSNLSLTKKSLTILPQPDTKHAETSVQLGLFDAQPAENIDRAMAYLNTLDETVIQKQTARLINTVKVRGQSDQEIFVLIAAKSQQFKQYVYKLYSNAEEISFPSNWQNASAISNDLDSLLIKLKQFNHNFYSEGDGGFHFNFTTDDIGSTYLNNLPDYYKEGTLTIHDNQIGFASYLTNKDQPVFIPSLNYRKDIAFYEQYLLIRDAYFALSNAERNFEQSATEARRQLNQTYDKLVASHGYLNSLANRQRILKDEAFGLMMLASLERKNGEQFIKADILNHSLVQKPEVYKTDNVVEALARSLNDKGKVDVAFISAATGMNNEDVIQSLSNRIYKNPVDGNWQTADQLLSGNVVAKLGIAQATANENPEDNELQKSLQALSKVQPEKIPFELLDFNLGERWIPHDFYNRFATHLFELHSEINFFKSADTFKVKVSGSNAKINSEYAVTTKTGKTTYGYTLLEHALENTSPFYTYEIQQGDKTIRIPDNDAIQLAHQKIEGIRTQFTAWLADLPARDQQQIETLYNNTFNCYVLREYDGSHLKFPQLDKKNLGIEDLYSSQKNSVWRIVQNRGALIDHEVGLSKTLTMIIA